jgi:CBS domain-containing protein
MHTSISVNRLILLLCHTVAGDVQSMALHLHTYQALYHYRQNNLIKSAESNEMLNTYHDKLIQEALQIALTKIEEMMGQPPTEFSFFMMGSAGRAEQGIWSDQDHGIIYLTESAHSQEYFLALGTEISEALQLIGYEKCEGRVMCSNPKWCKSLEDWQAQIDSWIETKNWESIRHLLVFADSRVLIGSIGSYEHLFQLRQQLFDAVIDSPILLDRMLQNTQHIKKSVGLLGQLLVEHHGPYTGCVNIKDKAFFPYVNMARLVAIKEKIISTPTKRRLEEICAIPRYKNSFAVYMEYYEKLLALRLDYQKKHLPPNYESSHYINVDFLTKHQRNQLKLILEGGIELNRLITTLFEKGC